MAGALDARMSFRLAILVAGMLLADDRRTASSWFAAAGVHDDWDRFYDALIRIGRESQEVSEGPVCIMTPRRDQRGGVLLWPQLNHAGVVGEASAVGRDRVVVAFVALCSRSRCAAARRETGLDIRDEASAARRSWWRGVAVTPATLVPPAHRATG